MHTLNLITVFVSSLALFASVIGAVVGFGYTDNLLFALLRPIAEFYIVHPVFFIVTDTFLTGLSILVPVLVTRDSSKEVEQKEETDLRRFFGAVCIQSLLLLGAAVAVYDVAYVWSMPVLAGLYLLRSVVLGVSRMYLVRLPYISRRDVAAASILNIHLFWASFLFFLSLAATWVAFLSQEPLDFQYVTFGKYTGLFFIGLFALSASLTILSDIHVVWIIVTIDALVATYPYWTGLFVPALFIASLVVNTLVVLYTMPCLVLVLLRQDRYGGSLGYRDYLLNGFNFWELLDRNGANQPPSQARTRRML